MKNSESVIPNAYIIGVQKAGTTSLHHWLSQHPDIFGPSDLKDRDILIHPEQAKNAVEYFSKVLKNRRNEKIVLHSQVNYILYPQALQKIAEISPKAKLILVLRNPVDRAISAYNYFKSLEKEDRPIKKALHYYPQKELMYGEEYSNLTYIEHGYYFQQIKRVFELFDKSQLLILDFQDLKDSPLEVLNKIYNFLGVSYFEPDLTPKNITRSVKLKSLQKLLVHTSTRQRRFMELFVDPWFPTQKRQRLKKWIREKNTRKDIKVLNEVPSEILIFLHNHFEKEVKNLDKLLGSDYTDRWIKKHY